MATHDSLLEKISDITECPICADTMTDPRMLPCVHTFCFKCLDEHWKDKQSRDKVNCPVCRKKLKIPSGGLVKMQSNFFVQKLMDAQKSNPWVETTDCDICSSGTIDASIFCEECQQSMCLRCSEEHLTMTNFEFHHFSNVETCISGMKPSMDFSSISKCDIHREKKLKIFCNDCKFAVCTACFLVDHKKHDGSDVKEVVARLKNKIREDIDMVDILADEIRDEKGYLGHRVEHFSRSVKETEKRIVARGEEMKRNIDDHVSVLLEKLDMERERITDEIDEIKEDLDYFANVLHRHKNYLAHVLNHPVPYYIANNVDEFNRRSQDLASINFTRAADYVEATFTPSTSPIFGSGDSNLIGDIDISYAAFRYSTIKKPLAYTRDPQLIATIELNSPVRGMTVTNQELFLICECSHKVLVYDACTSVYKLQFHIHELFHPRSITSTNNTLFISTIDEVYRVEWQGRAVTRKWAVDKTVVGLSMTEQGNLLLSCRPASGDLCKLCEYTQDGIPQREIILPAEMEGLNHALQINNDRFLLTHVNFAIDMHRVCLVDNKGNLIKSSRRTPGSGHGQLDDPREFAVDRQGSILVSCNGNNTVVLLNSKLELVEEMIRFPSTVVIGGGIATLLLDEVSRQLYVPNNNNKSIGVFKLK